MEKRLCVIRASQSRHNLSLGGVYAEQYLFSLQAENILANAIAMSI
jgi:hypothetical protein